jgi:hypothetical protein
VLVTLENIQDIYQNSKLLNDIRDYSKIKGKFGVCEYREICGGSRSRSYTLTGSYHNSDPYCIYNPIFHPPKRDFGGYSWALSPQLIHPPKKIKKKIKKIKKNKKTKKKQSSQSYTTLASFSPPILSYLWL